MKAAGGVALLAVAVGLAFLFKGTTTAVAGTPAPAPLPGVPPVPVGGGTPAPAPLPGVPVSGARPVGVGSATPPQGRTGGNYEQPSMPVEDEEPENQWLPPPSQPISVEGTTYLVGGVASSTPPTIAQIWSGEASQGYGPSVDEVMTFETEEEAEAYLAWMQGNYNR